MNIDAIMSKMQEFASTWAVVDGRFDDGTAMERAEQCKDEIRLMLADHAALDKQKAGPSDLEVMFLWFGVVNHEGRAGIVENTLAFARDLLSKYGAPVAKGEPVSKFPERNEVVSDVYRLCESIPGANTWNAAEFMYDKLIKCAAPANEQDARDAERYRWLRDECGLSVRDVVGPWCSQLNDGLDAAVDAAIAQQGKGE